MKCISRYVNKLIGITTFINLNERIILHLLLPESVSYTIPVSHEYNPLFVYVLLVDYT